MSAIAAVFGSLPVALVAKVTLIFLLGHVVALVTSRAVPALRHRVWALTLLAALALPPALVMTPAWRIAVLPAAPALGAPAPPPAGFEPQPAPTPISTLQTARPLPTRAAIEPAHSLNWPLIAWLGGLAVVLGWMAVGRLILRRVARRARALDSPEWRALLADEVKGAKVTQSVRLLASASARVPVTWGIRAPVVLLPAEAEAWSEERRRVVLRHELAHVARGDASTQAMATLACAVYWFHPLAWIAARRLVAERERACDDRVLAAGTPAADYAAHLLEIARDARAAGALALVTANMARPSQLEGRLLAVLHTARRRGDATQFSRNAGLLAAAGVVAGVSAFRPIPRQLAATPMPPAPARVIATSREDDSTITRNFAVEPGGLLSLDLETGADITITAWDRDSVSVHGHLAGRDWRQTAVTIERTADGVHVATRSAGSAGSQSSDDRFTVSVPERYDVRITSGGGSVAIAGLDGDVRGHTGGGPITIDRARGHVELSTGGGTVNVRHSNLSGSVSTGGGGVTLDDVTGPLVASSGGSVAFRAADTSGDASGVTTGDAGRTTLIASTADLDAARAAQRAALERARDALDEARHESAAARARSIHRAEEALRAARESGEMANQDRQDDLTDVADISLLSDEIRDVVRQFAALGGEIGRGVAAEVSRDISAQFAWPEDGDWARDGVTGVAVGADVRYTRRIVLAGGAIDLASAPGGAYLHTGGGAITVGSSDADVVASTGAGSIRLGPVAGSAVAHTGAGDVTVVVTGAGSHSVDVITGQGAVILELPSSLSARFELETAYTENSDHPTQIRSAWPLDTSTTSDWDDTEGTPRRYVRATGAVGAGEGLIRVKAVNGDIIVRKR